MTREQKALRRLKEIEAWAQAWVDHWTEFEELQKMICSYYDKPAAKAEIQKYQIILDAIDGKIDLDNYPPESWTQQLRRFP
jgi:hypothetical protein